VPEKNIHITGFPLPKENIGGETTLEILKEDLFNRLVRLDPTGKFFGFNKKTVFDYLDRSAVPEQKEDCFVLTFAVGGSGVQSELAHKILRSLDFKIKEGKVKLNLAAGIQQEVYREFIAYVEMLGLESELGKGLNIVHDEDLFTYFDKFNAVLRTTDVLWTKPSELSFYCALGIPILLAPAVGSSSR
jgi:hypothetical protein